MRQLRFPLRYRHYTRQPNHWAVTSRYNGVLLDVKHWPLVRTWRWRLKLGRFETAWNGQARHTRQDRLPSTAWRP